MEAIELTGKELNLLERIYNWGKLNLNSTKELEVAGRYEKLWGWWF